MKKTWLISIQGWAHSRFGNSTLMKKMDSSGRREETSQLTSLQLRISQSTSRMILLYHFGSRVAGVRCLSQVVTSSIQTFTIDLSMRRRVG